VAPSHLAYQTGFGNHFATESISGTLPVARNSPQKVAKGLYAEQLSGSAFTALPHENLRSWLYRIQPSVKLGAAAPVTVDTWQSSGELPSTPDQLRWSPKSVSGDFDFVTGIWTYAVSGSPLQQSGCGAHAFFCNKNMGNKALINADAELLIVVQEGSLVVRTEFGILALDVGMVACIPKGICFSVDVTTKSARGYLCENYGAPFQLPYRGPIGSNGLANHRDFEYPVAAFEDRTAPYKVMRKYLGSFYEHEIDRSPFDVVAWHGNYAPYRYDLRRFNTINTVSYDHPDPSIFTVLTSPSTKAGVANIDFVIFPPRWMVGEDTFRPPWFHRNVMSEFMGLLYGEYDAKPGDGFTPGGASLHNAFSAHGPDYEAFEAASNTELKPHKLSNTMAFMFESGQIFLPTKQALTAKELQTNYTHCWKSLKVNFRL
jgi:homogentisate 1,2-dioxygenase